MKHRNPMLKFRENNQVIAIKTINAQSLQKAPRRAKNTYLTPNTTFKRPKLARKLKKPFYDLRTT
jgi:hypothetical protein